MVPRTRLNLDRIRDYTRDQLMAELDYLGIQYRGKSQTYEQVVVDHHNSGTSTSRCITINTRAIEVNTGTGSE